MRWLAVFISPLGRVRDHLQRLGVGLDRVDGELLERSLHPQQRRDVRFVVDAPGHGEKVAQPLPEHLICGVAGPAEKGPVHVFDPATGREQDVPAGRVLDHVGEIEMLGVSHGRSDEGSHRGHDFFRSAKVRAVTGRLQNDHPTPWNVTVDVVSDLL